MPHSGHSTHTCRTRPGDHGTATPAKAEGAGATEGPGGRGLQLAAAHSACRRVAAAGVREV